MRRNKNKDSFDFSRRNRDIGRQRTQPEPPRVRGRPVPNDFAVNHSDDLNGPILDPGVGAEEMDKRLLAESVDTIRRMQWHWLFQIEDEVHVVMASADRNKLPKHLSSLTAKYVDVRFKTIDDLPVPICSCDEDSTRKNSIESMSEATATLHIANWAKDECYHCSQVRLLYSPHQFHASVTNALNVQEVFPPTKLKCVDPKTPQLTGVWAANRKTVGVIRTYKNAPPTCHSCGSTNCDHITARKACQESIEPDSDEEIEEDEGDEESVNETYIVPNCPITDRNVPAECVPLRGTDLCEHGGSMKKILNRAITCFDFEGVEKKVSIYDLVSDCPAQCYYELRMDELTNFVFLNASTACHRLLLTNYRSLLKTNANSLSGYHRYLLSTADVRQEKAAVLSKSTLQRLWRVFLKNSVEERDGFGCQKCGDFPEVLIFDGTRLGVKNTALGSHAAQFSEQVLPTIPYSRRVLVRNRDNRRQIRLYAESKVHFGGLRLVSLEEDIANVLNISVGADQMCLPEYKRLLKEFVVDGSIAASVQGSQEEKLRRCWMMLIDGETDLWEDPTKLQLFMHHQPTYYECFNELRAKGGIPDETRRVLARMMEVADFTYSLPTPPDTAFGPPTETIRDFFPLWPKIRGDGRYNKDAIDATACSDKVQDAHYALSPGIMVCACPHQGLFGFSLLQSGESPKHVMKIMLERIPDDRLPTMVYYDNGCKLLEYVLSREALRFSRTKIIIDDFHCNNHVGCSMEIRAKSYKFNKSMNRTNSQAVEQLNRKIKKVKSFVQFLNVDDFMRTMAMYMSTT